MIAVAAGYAVSRGQTPWNLGYERAGALAPWLAFVLLWAHRVLRSACDEVANSVTHHAYQLRIIREGSPYLRGVQCVTSPSVLSIRLWSRHAGIKGNPVCLISDCGFLISEVLSVTNSTVPKSEIHNRPIPELYPQL